MTNIEFRTSTSIFSEINRLVHDIESHRALASDFYEELTAHVAHLKDNAKSEGVAEKKRLFKRIGVILEELQEHYWSLMDLLTELGGIEILDTKLPEIGAKLSRDLIDNLKEMESSIRNAYKTLHSIELGESGADLESILEEKTFFQLNEVLKELFVEIDNQSDHLENLRQKRIL
ncbi:MAG: hypothetical protein EAX86_00090 [Candidatus Heimdallarchaeota archaeon]|nr:hypothetical protein [Candidatus Heimdallarchaeota archaeon]